MIGQLDHIKIGTGSTFHGLLSRARCMDRGPDTHVMAPLYESLEKRNLIKTVMSLAWSIFLCT